MRHFCLLATDLTSAGSQQPPSVTPRAEGEITWAAATTRGVRPPWRLLRAAGFFAVLLAGVFGAATAAQAQDAAGPARDVPIYEEEPYDLVILNDAAKTEYRVLPLTLPGGVLPKKPRPSDKLRIHLLEDSDEDYDVQWQFISQVKLFPQLVVEEAQQRIAEKKFNEAYNYFQFLRDEYPHFDGFNQAYADYLYEEAKDWQRKGNYENALVLLRSLFARQPQRPALEMAMAAATGRLLEKYVAAGDNATVRSLVRQLHDDFPTGSTAKQFEQQMNARAVQVVAAGRAKLEAGDPQEALALARRAMAVYPRADGAVELAADAFRRFPHVVVGVTAPYSEAPRHPLTDWSARRLRRLLERQIFEFVGYGANGGEYICPFGTYDVSDLGRKLSIHVRPDIPWAHGDQMTGYDVARRLLVLARPGSADFRPGFAESCETVNVVGIDTAVVRFRTPQILPPALLTVPPASMAENAGDFPTSIRPFVPQPPSADHVNFQIGSDYFARTPDMPQAIVERPYRSRLDALAALHEGEVSIVDRVPPWEVARLKTVRNITVAPYAVPTIHCLVPNLQNPFIKNRSFRRALIYGINRPTILSDQVLKRTSVAGCQVVSGPFAKAAGFSDATGYAYNIDIDPRAYEPRLALTLAAVGQRELIRGAGEEGDKFKEFPTLRLAHPADDVIAIACRAIQRDLAAIGLTVELREIPAGAPVEMGENDDLLYVELSITEPLVDARRLFDETGVCGRPSSYMALVLREVETATGWNEAREALYDLHRLVFEDVSLIPLWQITEHFAYDNRIEGVASKPMSLYQAVEQWHPQPPQPMEEAP